MQVAQTTTRLALAAALGLAAGACERDATPATLEDTYDVPVRSDAEARAAIAAGCRAAVEAGEPLLLEFTAGWCPDSRTVRLLQKEPPAAEELRRWEAVAIHVGRFDRHDDLRRGFDVERIATWVALRPEDCDGDPWTWPRLDRVVLEPMSDAPISAGELAAWLEGARTSDG